MLAIDQLKEQVGYLKLWLGFVMVMDISLLGWSLSFVDTAERLRILLASFGVILLSFGVVVLHLQITRRIDQIGKL
jgi:hypothetical protein